MTANLRPRNEREREREREDQENEKSKEKDIFSEIRGVVKRTVRQALSLNTRVGGLWWLGPCRC